MGRRLAILADIHGNLVALRAVLADAVAAGAEELVVAGDLVNRGPDSAAVVDLLRARGARLLRGNHEADCVAAYGTPAAPPAWATSPGYGLLRWTMEALGPERRSFLAALPDRLWLDDATVVAHRSPRVGRDAVRADTPESALAAMLPNPAIRLAFVGHTHRSLIRELPARGAWPACRFVNVGAVGDPLDGDPRASYALAVPGPSGEPGDWRIELRRVPYDISAAVAALDVGLRAACPEWAEVIARNLHTGRDHFGPAVRALAAVPDEEALPVLRRLLAASL